MLPSDFLHKIAENYKLTDREKEVFVKKFGSDKNDQEIADELFLSSSAFRSRLSAIYRKFGYGSEKGPVKSELLLRFLSKKYQKSHPTLLAEYLVAESDIDAQVQEVRERVRQDIQKRCGSMRVLDMTQPIGLSDIYTEVNVLEEILGHRRLEIAQLLESCYREDFDSFGLRQVTKKRIPGLEAVEQFSKLMILGKPGAGKTTFLKWVATQCNQGKFLAECVPIFISLKDFAEATKQPGLLQYITSWFAENEISDQETIAKTLLREGRAVVLLDGLDEVRQVDNDRILKEIRDLSIRFDTNYFVIACRIAAKEYTFEQFTEVEVANFGNQQIANFVTNWFQAKDPEKAQQFLQKLQENRRIKELATNPLLLTLLCLLFGESTDFPANRSELYEEALDILLRKWDGTRRIERDQAYRKLSLKRKEDLLSQIALTTFEQGNYFFKQRQAEQYITNYIQNLPDAKTDPEALELDSRVVLKSIEAQHGLLIEQARGIYSFSHLTFHEFFTARNIALSHNPQQAFQQLVSYITNRRWREVFLLTVGILPNADNLVQLMKQHTDALLINDAKLQQFLNWLDQKTRCLEVSYKKAAVRAFYLGPIFPFTRTYVTSLNPDLARIIPDSIPAFARSLDPALARVPSIDPARFLPLDPARLRALPLDPDRILPLNSAMAVDQSLNRALELAFTLSLRPALELRDAITLNYHIAITLDLVHAVGLGFQNELRHLKEQLPDTPDKNLNDFNSWWQANCQAWTEQLRAVMIQHRNIGHNWQFNKSEKNLLKQYYDANNLLVDCLNSDCYVSRKVRQEIEDTLLSPVRS